MNMSWNTASSWPCTHRPNGRPKLWFRLGNYEATIEHLRAYTEAGGDETRETAYLMGFSLYNTTRYDEATGWLRKACIGAEDALTQNASYHLADCYLRAGNKQDAMQAFAIASAGELDKSPSSTTQNCNMNRATISTTTPSTHCNNTSSVIRNRPAFPKPARC